MMRYFELLRLADVMGVDVWMIDNVDPRIDLQRVEDMTLHNNYYMETQYTDPRVFKIHLEMEFALKKEQLKILLDSADLMSDYQPLTDYKMHRDITQSDTQNYGSDSTTNTEQTQDRDNHQGNTEKKYRSAYDMAEDTVTLTDTVDNATDYSDHTDANSGSTTKLTSAQDKNMGRQESETGYSAHAPQELVRMQRDLADFNIYKWIYDNIIYNLFINIF